MLITEELLRRRIHFITVRPALGVTPSSWGIIKEPLFKTTKKRRLHLFSYITFRTTWRRRNPPRSHSWNVLSSRKPRNNLQSRVAESVRGKNEHVWPRFVKRCRFVPKTKAGLCQEAARWVGSGTWQQAAAAPSHNEPRHDLFLLLLFQPLLD